MNGSRKTTDKVYLPPSPGEHSKLYLSVSKRLYVRQDPLLMKCNTERQEDSAEGAAAHGWIAATLAGEQPARQAVTSPP